MVVGQYKALVLGEFGWLSFREVTPQVCVCVGIGVSDWSRLCGKQIMWGRPLWLSGQSLLDGRRIGRGSDIG